MTQEELNREMLTKLATLDADQKILRRDLESLSETIKLLNVSVLKVGSQIGSLRFVLWSLLGGVLLRPDTLAILRDIIQKQL